MLFRLQLGFPDQTFPILETFFGHYANGGQIQPEFYYALITMHGTVLVFFVLTAGLERNVCQPSYSIPMRRQRYGFSVSKYAILLVFLYGECSNGFILVCKHRSCQWWMDNVSAFECIGRCKPTALKLALDLWLIAMALFVVSSLLGGLKLYFHHSQHAYEGNEHDEIATNHLGTFLYSYFRCIVIPCFTFRIHSCYYLTAILEQVFTSVIFLFHRQDRLTE